MNIMKVYRTKPHNFRPIYFYDKLNTALHLFINLRLFVQFFGEKKTHCCHGTKKVDEIGRLWESFISNASPLEAWDMKDKKRVFLKLSSKRQKKNSTTEQ